MKRLAAALAGALALSAAPLAALAVEPEEMLSNQALETRAQKVSQELRCVVCQNQNIDDSRAPLARDMRLLVRERILAGDSDQEVKAYLVNRYGDFVLLRPPFQTDTLALWIGPAVILLLAAAGLIYAARSGAPDLGEDPSSEEDIV